MLLVPVCDKRRQLMTTEDNSGDDLHERLERLEHSVDELRRFVTEVHGDWETGSVTAEPKAEVPVPKPEVAGADERPARKEEPECEAQDTDDEASPEPEAEPEPERGPERRTDGEEPGDTSEIDRKGEYWLNKAGIALLLVGLALLFKYSIEQGWISPPVRIAFGLALGTGFVLLGLRLHSRRRHFAQVLLGGGVAALYTTGLAALNLYELVSYPVAFAYMSAVSVLCFVLSVRQDSTVLSLIGVIGALTTPFALHTETANIPGLMGYTCIVIAAVAGIYLVRGWRTLLWIGMGGTSLVLLLCQAIASDRATVGSTGPLADRTALQFGYCAAWLAFWALPIIRRLLAETNPARWPVPSSRFFGVSPLVDFRGLVRFHAHLLTLFVPLLILGLTADTWSLSQAGPGWLFLVGAATHGLACGALAMWSRDREQLGYVQILMSQLLVAMALYFFFDGNVLLLAWTVQALVLALAARRRVHSSTALSAHILFAVAFLWVVVRLKTRACVGTAMINERALVELVVLGAVAFAATRFNLRELRLAYFGLAHAAFLGWFVRELHTGSHGAALVTIAWGAYAIGMLLFGLVYDRRFARVLAMLTLLLVVAKLFLVDLHKLKALWRVFLFLCSGGVLMLLSYYYQTLMRKKPPESL